MLVLGLVVGGMFQGYVMATHMAEWNAHSLAAQSLAFQATESARAAKWDPQAWPKIDELGVTNFTQIDILDVPVRNTPIYATNYVSVTWARQNPPIRQIQADCVWTLGSRGPFTNSVVTLRAADQ